MQIDFYKMPNLIEPKFSHHVTPHHPGRLATRVSSPKLLLYHDQGSRAVAIGFLDCNTNPPKTTNVIKIPQFKESQNLELQDMISCVTVTSDQLIIKSFGSGGICASHKLSGEIRWEIKGRLPGMDKWMAARGIDTDGLGHLLVCDTANLCIQMFSLNGDYLGVLLRSEEQDLGTPFRIRWCHVTSSAVVLHHRHNRCCISVFHPEFFAFSTTIVLLSD